MQKSQIVHVAAETIVFAGLFAYVYGENQAMKKRIEKLEEDVQIVAKHQMLSIAQVRRDFTTAVPPPGILKKDVPAQIAPTPAAKKKVSFGDDDSDEDDLLDREYGDPEPAAKPVAVQIPTQAPHQPHQAPHQPHQAPHQPHQAHQPAAKVPHQVHQPHHAPHQPVAKVPQPVQRPPQPAVPKPATHRPTPKVEVIEEPEEEEEQEEESVQDEPPMEEELKPQFQDPPEDESPQRHGQVSLNGKKKVKSMIKVTRSPQERSGARNMDEVKKLAAKMAAEAGMED
jgi:hypothetical protein